MTTRSLFAALALAALAVYPTSGAEPRDVAARVDEVLRAEWKKAGLTPAPRAGDAQFLRRAFLDLTGSLPPADRAARFLDDRDPEKRTKLLDELLASERYADHMADYWDAILMGRLTREAFLDRAAFRGWLHKQFADNAPWDQTVTRLLTAEGYNTDRSANGANDPSDLKQRFDPATNWFLRYFKSLPEAGGATAKNFLGVRIQCAQCHDHKEEKWTQDDFRRFTAFFAKTWPTYYDKTLTVGIVRMDTKDRIIAPPTTGKAEMYYGSYRDYASPVPRSLDGKEVRTFRSRRVELAKWITAKDNPYFANAMANRLWARMLGTGFVEPIDDFRPSNSPAAPEALKLLADDFTAHNYDLKRLLRVIGQTEAYQLASVRPEKMPKGHTLWSHYPVKHLDVEPLLDVVLQGTGAGEWIDKVSKGKLDLIRLAFVRQFVTQMGTDDMAEVVASEETMAQALLFLNGSLLNATTRATPGLALADVLRSTSDDRERIEKLYLRTLSRRPTAAETQTWLAFLKKPRDVVKAQRASLPPTRVSPEIAKANADEDFKELLKHAKSAPDFQALGQRMRNNADAGLLAKAFESWAADFPFQYLASQEGGRTATEQAYEDLVWAMLNGTEFLSNH